MYFFMAAWEGRKHFRKIYVSFNFMKTWIVILGMPIYIWGHSTSFWWAFYVLHVYGKLGLSRQNSVSLKLNDFLSLIQFCH